MAENLGEAQLRLTVDTGAVDKELKRLRDAIQNFAPDFKAVKAGLRTVTTEAKAASDSAKSLAFNLNQVPASKLEGLSKQIKALQVNLRGAKIQSEEFLTALTRIQELEGLRDIRVGRQSVLAGQQAYSPSGAMGQLDQAQLPQLPLTLAGERQNIDELKRKLSNLDYESAAYSETLRVLQRAQERYNNILNATSSEYQKLAQQEEAAIRRAEKLAGIQSYYADRNPRAGGVRDESGAMLARGAGSVADERAYQAALRPARELLDTDLKRAQVLREISQRILATAQASEGGFGAASASNFGTTDPVTKAIRRNAERSAQRLEALTAQRDALESDLIDVQARRVKTETARAELADKLLAAERSGSSGGTQGPLGRGASRFRQNLPSAVSSALIGGAFPALFGQGAGASVGGALGGALGIFGGGFGFAGSLIGTSVGQQADNLGKLSQALQDPIGRFQELQQAAVLSSRSLEKNIEALINAGRYAEAEAKIREDLAKRGLDAATTNQLAAESDKLQRSLAELGLSIGLVVQGPLTDLINGFNRLLEPGRVAAQSRAIQDGLNPEDRAAYQDRRRELNRGGLGIVDANKQANEEFADKTRDAIKAQEELTKARLRDNATILTQSNSLAQLEQNQTKLPVDSSEFIAATKQILETQTALENLDGKKATITIEQIKAGVADGSLPNNFSNLEKRAQAAQQALNSAEFGSTEFNKALSEADAANFELARRRELADPNRSNKLFEENRQKVEQAAKEGKAKQEEQAQKLLEEAKKAEADARKGVENSFSRLQSTTNALASAQDSLRSSLEGAFNLLTDSRQQSLLTAARADLQTAVRAGFFDTGKVAKLKDSELLSAASQARAVLKADDALLRSQIDLVSANEALEKATTTLAEKDWNVKVDVNANSGNYAVNLG